MPKRDDDLLVADMIECCEKIMDYVKGKDYNTFLSDRKTIDAVIRNFEVLGEAANYISEETKLLNQLIEWRKIADFRNILIHNYFGINYETMWQIIQDDLSDQLEFLNQLDSNL
jgi:uncharacterized protein with HEPN domain